MTADPTEKWKARAEKIAIELGGFGTVRDARKSLLAQRIAAALAAAYAVGEIEGACPLCKAGDPIKRVGDRWLHDGADYCNVRCAAAAIRAREQKP